MQAGLIYIYHYWSLSKTRVRQKRCRYKGSRVVPMSLDTSFQVGVNYKCSGILQCRVHSMVGQAKRKGPALCTLDAGGAGAESSFECEAQSCNTRATPRTQGLSGSCLGSPVSDSPFLHSSHHMRLYNVEQAVQGAFRIPKYCVPPESQFYPSLSSSWENFFGGVSSHGSFLKASEGWEWALNGQLSRTQSEQTAALHNCYIPQPRMLFSACAHQSSELVPAKSAPHRYR